jgi:hypothetical protein
LTRLLVLLIVGGIISLIIKLSYKYKMEKALGREVRDHELTSISAWMQAQPAADAERPSHHQAGAQVTAQGQPYFVQTVAATRPASTPKEYRGPAKSALIAGIAAFVLIPLSFLISRTTNSVDNYFLVSTLSGFAAFTGVVLGAIAVTRAKAHARLLGGSHKTAAGLVLSLAAGVFLLSEVFYLTNMVAGRTFDRLVVPERAAQREEYMRRSSEETARKEAEKKAQPQQAALPAMTLLSEYQKDSAAADRKYKGTTVLISGAVEAVGKSKKGIPFVGFMRAGAKNPAGEMVVCNFDPGQESAVLGLKKGQQVKLKGRVWGSLLGNPMIEKCSLQQ